MGADRFGSLENRTILYTGAAGGLGLETTLELLRSGARVVAIDNDANKVAALLAAAEGLGGLTVAKLDLADLTGLRAGLQKLSAEVGGFDIVINNAAIYPSKPFEDYSIEEMQLVQRINVDAGIVCVQVALPHMKTTKRGRIINISSVTISGGWSDLTPYVQSKMALVGLTRSWAREFGKHGITVNAVAPGAFPTDAEKIHPDLAAYEKRIYEAQALQRRGAPGDIANILMFLASDAASFITGQTIHVDGGWYMH
ncbi:MULTISPECIES: SDR family oxidoreductase [unclassified Devosia]|uniref:SDR family NAD(P)-dependent oxidoreductase n=1 Tax=unclassified Devosia TaxID=196773 RepID=UPI000969B043|nr:MULTISPECIES: SDR family oxidoreductase [unclassified Devosia]MBN9363241.1 SDR family oxidoreductase [Devosia sp.]OJX25085.1 MAG: oxidoreductase [Devosia sp. 66-14]